MEVTVKEVVDGNDADEPVIIQDEYERQLYDGRLGDVPEHLYKRVVKLTGWLMVTKKHLIKVEAESDGRFLALTDFDAEIAEFVTEVTFVLTEAAWKKLEKTAEWKAFLRRLGKLQEE